VLSPCSTVLHPFTFRACVMHALTKRAQVALYLPSYAVGCARWADLHRVAPPTPCSGVPLTGNVEAPAFALPLAALVIGAALATGIPLLTALEATQGQIDGFFSQLGGICGRLTYDLPAGIPLLMKPGIDAFEEGKNDIGVFSKKTERDDFDVKGRKK